MPFLSSITRGASLLALLCLCLAGSARANDGGGQGGAALFARLEAFTVNLQGPDQYLQVIVALKLSDPGVNELVKVYMPIIRHNMILLLASKSARDLVGTTGKEKLKIEVVETVNKAIKRSDRDGVADAMFESFLIQ